MFPNESETESIKVRKALKADLDAVWTWYQSGPRLALMKANLRAGLTKANLTSWWQAALNRKDLELMIGTLESLRVGLAITELKDAKARLYLALNPSYCGKTLTALFAAGVASYLRDKYVTLKHIHLEINRYNPASILLLDRALAEADRCAQTLTVEL